MPVAKHLTVGLLVLMLCACSGADQDTPAESPAEEQIAQRPTTPGVHLSDSGEQPHVQLSITELGQSTAQVAATSRSQGTIGDEPVADSIDATYQLGVDIMSSDDPAQLIVQFSAADISTTGFTNRDDPGVWEWRIGADGVLRTTSLPVSSRGSRLGELLGAQGLFLMVPDDAVGEGATWTYLAIGGGPPVEVNILDISDDAVEATVTSRVETSDATIDINTSGRWDRQRLLAKDVTSRIAVELRSTTTRNGETVPVVMTKTVEFTFGDAQ